jgi:hypothetical protein
VTRRGLIEMIMSSGRLDSGMVLWKDHVFMHCEIDNER